MNLLGFRDGVKHGIERAVYLFSFVENLQNVIRFNEEPIWFERSIDELVNYWRKHWVVKRMNNYPEEKLRFSKEEFLQTVKKDLLRCKSLFADEQK